MGTRSPIAARTLGLELFFDFVKTPGPKVVAHGLAESPRARHRKSAQIERGLLVGDEQCRIVCIVEHLGELCLETRIVAQNPLDSVALLSD